MRAAGAIAYRRSIRAGVPTFCGPSQKPRRGGSVQVQPMAEGFQAGERLAHRGCTWHRLIWMPPTPQTWSDHQRQTRPPRVARGGLVLRHRRTPSLTRWLAPQARYDPFLRAAMTRSSATTASSAASTARWLAAEIVGPELPEIFDVPDRTNLPVFADRQAPRPVRRRAFGPTICRFSVLSIVISVISLTQGAHI